MGGSQLLQLLDLMSKMYGKLTEDAFFFFLETALADVPRPIKLKP